MEISNFSFSYNVFHGYISFVRQNVELCGNELTVFQLYSTGQCTYLCFFWNSFNQYSAQYSFRLREFADDTNGKICLL